MKLQIFILSILICQFHSSNVFSQIDNYTKNQPDCELTNDQLNELFSIYEEIIPTSSTDYRLYSFNSWTFVLVYKCFNYDAKFEGLIELYVLLLESNSRLASISLEKIISLTNNMITIIPKNFFKSKIDKFVQITAHILEYSNSALFLPQIVNSNAKIYDFYQIYLQTLMDKVVFNQLQDVFELKSSFGDVFFLELEAKSSFSILNNKVEISVSNLTKENLLVFWFLTLFDKLQGTVKRYVVFFFYSTSLRPIQPRNISVLIEYRLPVELLTNLKCIGIDGNFKFIIN